MSRMIRRSYSYWMVAPVLILFLVLFILPSLQGVYYSLTAWDGFTARFIGLDNFRYIFENPDLSIAFKNTLLFTVAATLLKTIIAMVLALALNGRMRGRTLLRAVFFTPSILNNVAVGLLFTAILHPETGILNQFWRFIGLKFMALDWLTDTKLAIFSVAAIDSWKWTGFTMVILLAGLQSVPEDFYEAAQIDGATAWQKLKHVTLPLIMPAFNNALILNLIGALKIFDIIYATTGGGPGSSTEVLYTTVFKSFLAGHYGEASAANLLLAIFVALISITSFRALRKREVEY